MKILVTGGTGFIGSHTIVELLNAGFEVINIDNLSNSKEFINDRIAEITHKIPSFINGDILQYKTLDVLFSKYEIDAVIHFAAFKSVNESVNYPLKYYKNNLGGTLNLLDFMKSNGVTNLVFSSSCTVYGQPDVLPVNENSPIKIAESPYGRTKQICEDMIMDFQKSYTDLNAIILRYFNPIGAHPTAKIGELPIGVPANLVPYIMQTASGKRAVLKVFGNDYNTTDGTCIRDYIHVVDLAKAHVAAVKRLVEQKQSQRTEIYNIGTGVGNTVLEVIQAFEKATGQKLNYEFAPRRNGDIEKIFANVSKAQTELGWKSEFSLQDAMLHAWNWEKTLK